MRYLSVCAGIEAATVAWHPLGWEAIAFSEIEPFACAVLAHHWPQVPNLGDMTAYKEWQLGTIDLLVGGTPCQSFSVAGLRAGLDDPRGSLMLVYLAIARRFAPRWVVWENVPGVLSSHRGRDFGTFLGGLAECGYGFAYRVLDAQFFGVPQRRRRVFVVGYLGDWRAAAAVLFERESLRGYPAPSREAGERVAGTVDAGAHPGGFNGRDAETGKLIAAPITASYGKQVDSSDRNGGPPNLLAYAINAHGGSGRMDRESETFIADDYAGMTFAKSEIARPLTNSPDRSRAAPLVSQPLRAGRQYSDMGDGSANVVAHALRADGFDAGEDGTGRGTTLVAFQNTGHGWWNERETAQTIRTPDGGGSQEANLMLARHGVRRLTPKEAERLQGFPDDYTLIQYPPNPRRVKWAADGPRYRALGNSMAVPVMRWLGERIEMVERTGAGR